MFKNEQLSQDLIKRNNFVFTVFIFILSSSQISSQSCANYTVTRTTGITYTTIAGAGSNSFVWRNLTGGATNDDNRSIFTAIGFDFWYLGVRYTTFCASLNGFIDFSNSANIGTAGGAYGPLNGNEFSDGGAGGTMLALSPIYDDLWPFGQGVTPIASSMFYKVTGSAPNRVLTVEWQNMEKYKGAPYWVTPPSLTFQVKIYETSGLIQFVYGTMTQGTATFDYACGINNFWTPAAAPTATLLLTQQTANTTSFNATPQNVLNTVPASSTQLAFTPPAPSAAPSALSFSNVAKTSMELYWNDNASNELGYVILNSSDNVTFSFVSQLAANSVSTSVAGLLSGTTYYWRVHAVTEGDLGTAVTGTQATLASGTIISVASGSWTNTATWNCTCVPAAGDQVTIANTHVVVLDADAACLTLTVGQGTSGQLTFGNSGTTRNLTVTGDVLIQNGGVVTISNNNATHTMTLGGNLTNNGTLNLSTTANRHCNVTFNKNGNQTISGTGGTTFFNRIIMNMGNSISNVLEVSSNTFAVRSTNFLTLTNGTFKLSSPTGTITPFTGATTLTTSTGIWLNNASSTLLFGNTITMLGYIRVSSGTMNIGDANNENLIVNGGRVIVDGGTLNIAGRLSRSGLTSIVNLLLSSGNLVLGNVGSTTANEAIFRIDEIGSTFDMSGGSMVLRRPGAGNLGLVNTSTTNVSVTGGTLFVGDASTPASQTITINTAIPVQNISLGTGVAVTGSLLTNSLTVNNNLSINSGTLISNNLSINLGGNWLNSGVFTAGTSSVVFNGSSAQTISGVSTTTFNNLIVSNTSTTGLTCSAPTNVSGTLTLSTGKVFTDQTNILTMQAGSASSAGSSSVFVDGPMQKEGTTAFVFPIGDGGRWARLGIGAPSSSSTFRAEYIASSYTNTSSMATATPVLNNVSTQEYWQLDRVVGAGAAAVTLHWEDASFSGIDDCTSNDLRVAHWNTGTSEWENNNDQVTTSGSCVGVSPGSVTTSLQVTSFSPFTFGSLSSLINPLPIELLDFNATLQSSGVVDINWQTATEINNDYFTVEKSNDAIHFEQVAIVDGAGNSSERLEYKMTDREPYSGVSYYRLKQTDFDLSYSYSPLVSVNNKQFVDASVYPNPNNGSIINITISGVSSGDLNVMFYDALGRKVYETTVVKQTNDNFYKTSIDLSHICEPGVYYLVVADDQELVRKKIIITAP